MLNFNITEKTNTKLLINIGALFDVPTASIVTGKKGEAIFNGGLGQVTAIMGAGNNYKSTILHYQMLSAASKIAATTDTAMTTYDTEVNISLDRLEDLASKFDTLPKNPIMSDNPTWSVTDKSMVSANDWAVSINKYAEAKAKEKKIIQKFEAFTDPYSKNVLELPTPTFVEIDSLTEFEASSTMDMLTNDLDSSDTNTYAMKQGAFKTKFLSTLPRLTNSSNTFVLMTAHIGEKINMATGPAVYQQPTRKLQYLKGGDTIKGVSSKFTFLLNNAWFAHTASLLNNKTTKLPEYPRNKNDVTTTDLNTVKLTQLRSKSGPSGYTLEIVVSQTEGVLPTLTEFHFIKESDRFGLTGNNVHYQIALLPEVTLNRNNVRENIDKNNKLRRAINITSELLQLNIFHNVRLDTEGINCTPEELYKDIKELGYDWDVLLNTRGYWVIDQYENKIPYLNTIDLLRMRKGTYFPYFLNDDKTLKKKYMPKGENNG